MESAPPDDNSLPRNDRENCTEPEYIPRRDHHGNLITIRDEYLSLLNSCRRKDPLISACNKSNIRQPKSANLERLCAALLSHWFPHAEQAPQDGQPHISDIENSANEGDEDLEDTDDTAGASILHADAEDDEHLVANFDTTGADIDALLGFDDAEDGDEGSFEREIDPDDFEAFQTQTRVNETRRAEGNRRDGGIRTQKQVVKQWTEWVIPAICRGELRDRIVDVHHLLRWIIYCSERPKRTPKGLDIPGTRIGAAHIKKLFFGVLRIRKEQEAHDASLVLTRPATSVVVWDALKSRMNEALYRARNGLLEGEDAPDIVANTMLDQVTEKQIDEIGVGFLRHSHLHSVINGHLAWTSQNGSGNRGDDLRALKLAELQPYSFLHPSHNTPIEGVVSVQGEEKAGSNRMKTQINPSYSTWITHLLPERCPLGAFSFYFHYIHDVNDLLKKMNIDWSVNKSWRQVRVLHGPKSATTPYNEGNLYNLYVRAYAHAGFSSRLKAHLPRHLLEFISLRPYLFLCGAAIYEKCPNSALFRLPAFKNPSVLHWMKTQFRSEYTALKAEEGSPVNLQCIQDVAMRQSLERMQVQLAESNARVGALAIKMERQTAALSPTKAFSNELYQRRFDYSKDAITQPNFGAVYTPTLGANHLVASPIASGSRSMSVIDSPQPAAFSLPQDMPEIDPALHVNEARLVDLALPPIQAFYSENEPTIMWPSVLGQKNVLWEQVYALIRRPALLWDCWGVRPLDEYGNVHAQWVSYNSGEPVYNANGIQTHVKPPLRQVEQYFQARWRTSDKARKSWERFSEVPQYIEYEAASSGVPPPQIIDELEAMRERGEGKGCLSMNALMKEVKEMRKKKATERKAANLLLAAAPVVVDANTEDAPKAPKRKKAIDVRRHPAAKRPKM